MISERLAGLERKTIDDCTFYPLAGICRAFRIDQGKATKLIDKADKRYVYRYGKGYRSTVNCYINSHGVEVLAIRYSGQIGASRNDIMAALNS